MKELKINIGGRVQGVRFRHFVKTLADEFSLKGYVQNQPDGSVLIIVQGAEDYLKIFLERVQKGNAFSHVDSFYYIWRMPAQNFKDFEIKMDKPFFADQTSSFFNLGKNLLGIGVKPPCHVAIIPDGNRRWARGKGLDELEGHKKSGTYENLKSLLDEARKLKIKYFTIWSFSTENWNRSKKEVDALMELIGGLLEKIEKDLVKDKIRFRHLGRKDRLPEKLFKIIENLEEKTKDFDNFNLQICLDYGGRDEILRAVNKLLANGTSFVSEEEFMKYLDTQDIPDPDMIIRTSGEYRMSGFMPVQGAYAEFYFTDVHFPDFGPSQLREAVDSYYERQRRHGK